MRRALRLLAPFALALALAQFPAPVAVAASEPNQVDCDCWQKVRQQNFINEYPIDHVAPAYGFDSKRGKLVKFGGKAFVYTGLDSTWEWDGQNWTMMNPPVKPAVRYYSAMAYDHKRERLVLFAGYNQSPAPAIYWDTWEYDGTDWTQPPTANPPSTGGTATDSPAAMDFGGNYMGLFQHRLVWDPDREEIVLVGGATYDLTTFQPTTFPETWVYSGGYWTKKSPTTSPQARTAPGFAADPARSQVLLWGGSSGAIPSGNDSTETLATVNSMLTDTWTWNGSDWTKLNPAHWPEARLEAFAGDGNQATPPTLFGGQSAQGMDVDDDGELELLLGTLGDLWTWTGSDWLQQLVPAAQTGRDRTGSASRNDMIMAYDQTREQLVIAGGYSLSGQPEEATATWTWQPPFGRPMLARQYFAEGYTGGTNPFTEYMTVLNQSAQTATVRFRFLTDGGGIVDRDYPVGGQTRFTLNVNSVLGNGVAHGTIVYSDQPVYTERPMYFDFAGGRKGGHVDPGAQDLFKEFYFGEGYTGPGFDSFLTMLNPNGFAVTVDVTYLKNGAAPAVKTKVIPANSRLTVNVRDDIGSQEFSARVIARDGFIHVEEPIYFDYGGNPSLGLVQDGSVNKGQNMLSPTAEFAEGFTGTGFQEYLTLGNPNPVTATTTINYLPSVGPMTTTVHAIPPNERRTINVNTDLGPGVSHSTRIVADQPIAAARPMYFVYGGWPGGSVNTGFSSSRWALLPEGFVNTASFETILTLGNPWDTDTEVTATYIYEDGTNILDMITIPANGRFTRRVNDVVPNGTSFATFVITVDPAKTVLVERPMYFSYAGWPGGSVSQGYNGSPFPRYYP